ncbi:FAD/NAD(P)-binding domain-containing protein [Thozetella sp. PMI_491]|nr:FAD/NAD(P)-binding domain-containing protein [Thozetella sp. PMI_491]
MEQQNIVVVGAGFAGTWSALAARRLLSSHAKKNPAATEIQVTVIAPEPQLTIRPRLYEPNPAEKVAPLSDLFSATGVRFVQGTVEDIHVPEKVVMVVQPDGTRSTQPYSRLVLAAGSRLVRPNIKGLREHAFNVDQLEDAVELETHLQSLKSLPSSPARNTVVVCGAGFTGVEVAAEMTARLRAVLGTEADLRVILLTQGNEVGDTLGPNPRPTITHAIHHLGVQTKVGTTVTGVDKLGVTTATGERIEAMTTIWTAGVVATALTEQIPSKKDPLGRLYVDRDLRVSSLPDIFVAGDAACAATDAAGHYSLMSCQHAKPLGRVAGHNAAADLLGISGMDYSQPSYVTCLDLGAYGAVLTNGWDRKVVLAGGVAKKVKQYINTTMIALPEADEAKAMAAANPNHPTDSTQRLLGTSLSFISFFSSRIM